MSADAPTTGFAASETVKISIDPNYFNAPRRAVGSDDKTQFDGRGKPSAYLKVQLTQLAAGTSTQPLTYAALYPVFDSWGDDIGATFFSAPSSGDTIHLVPLPGGAGDFRSPIAAVVGGAKQSSLVHISRK